MDSMTGSYGKKVIVIGGGLSGLCVAYYLRKRGALVTVVEREPVVGGAVRTALKDDKYIVEYGPISFPARSEPVLKLARELSIDPQIVGSSVKCGERFIFSKDCLHSIPTSKLGVLRTGLLSFKGKMRLLTEPWVKSESADSESVADFAVRRGGREILDRIVEPLVNHVCGGDPAHLETKSAVPFLVDAERRNGNVLKSLFRYVDKVVDDGAMSFRWGMGTLTARLEEMLRRDLMVGVSAEELVRKESGKLSILIDVSHRMLDADAVVLATPAPEAARLLMSIDTEIMSPLMSIPYVPIAVINMVFSSKDIPTRRSGFGFSISRKEGMRMLGAVWTSSLFSGRCPNGDSLITCTMGGASDPDIMDRDDDEIESYVREALERVLCVAAQPKWMNVKRWMQALPQYNIGHERRVDKIEKLIESQPGLFLAGNYFSGVSVPNTITRARQVVDKVQAYLKRCDQK